MVEMILMFAAGFGFGAIAGSTYMYLAVRKVLEAL
jgi:hypothetical protein